MPCPLFIWPTFLPLPAPHLRLFPSPVFSQAAKLPMSIIIVGVGQAEFDGESSVPFPDVSSHRTPWHPVPTSKSSCLGGFVRSKRVCPSSRVAQPHHRGHTTAPGREPGRGEQGPSCTSVCLHLFPHLWCQGKGPRLAWDWRAGPVRCTLTHTHPLLVPTAMVELDGDDVRISSRGKLAERDIVQVKQALLSRASNMKASSQSSLRAPLQSPQGQTLESPPQPGPLPALPCMKLPSNPNDDLTESKPCKRAPCSYTLNSLCNAAFQPHGDPPKMEAVSLVLRKRRARWRPCP